WSYFELLTEMPAAEIAARRRGIESGAANPRDVKAELARAITAQFHGAQAASRAEEDFRRAFSKGGLPEEIEATELPPSARAAAAGARRGARPRGRGPRRVDARGAAQGRRRSALGLRGRAAAHGHRSRRAARHRLRRRSPARPPVSPDRLEARLTGAGEAR